MKETTNKDILEDFLKWIKVPIEKQFSHYKPLGDRILIRLYLYEPPAPSKVKIYQDLTSKKTASEEMRTTLFPIGKVLSLGNTVRDAYKKLKPGDLITVSDLMTGSGINPEWEKYHMMALEKPGMKERVPEPPKYQGYITQWKEFVFVQDKLCGIPNIQDAYTFLLPDRYILAKYED